MICLVLGTQGREHGKRAMGAELGAHGKTLSIREPILEPFVDAAAIFVRGRSGVGGFHGRAKTKRGAFGYGGSVSLREVKTLYVAQGPSPV